MSGLVSTLRELHRLRRHAKDLREQIERTPKLVKAQQAKAARQDELYREAQEELKKLKAHNLERESQLKATHQTIAKKTQSLNETSSTKEYQILQNDLANARKQSQQLEDAILAGIAEIEAKAAQLPEQEKVLQKARQESAEFEQAAEQRKAQFAELLKQAEEQLRQTEALLPADVRALYDRAVAARQEDALAVVKDQICVACYTSITSQNLNDLRSNRLVTCKACGRMLYLPE
jgi:predicted  nucleic acid-binding Zn-ribbon protein